MTAHTYVVVRVHVPSTCADIPTEDEVGEFYRRDGRPTEAVWDESGSTEEDRLVSTRTVVYEIPLKHNSNKPIGLGD
jgi:hypothetical protein